MPIRKSTIISTIVAVCALVIMLVVVIVNVRGLTASVNERTYNYLRDVSKQSAQVIDERFAGRMTSLGILGNSIAYAANLDLGEFLQRKLSETEFESLAYVRPDGTVITADPSDTRQIDHILNEHADSEALADPFEGKEVASLHHSYVAFLKPIMSKTNDTEVVGVMIGTVTTETLQDMLESDSFGGTGFTVIIDQTGQMLTESLNDEDDELLASLLSDLLSETDLRQELAAGSAEGTDSLEYTLETPNGNLLLDYQLLGDFDWVVVTAIDENLLAQSVNGYVARIIGTLTAFVALFAILLMLFVIQQRRYRKRVEQVAFVDPLTDGMSYARFRMLAEPLIEKSDSGDYAVATLNVKRFKLINRQGGSQEGDAVLRQLYETIKNHLNEPDEMVAHDMADSFVILMRNDGEEALRKRLREIAKDAEHIQTVMPVRISEGVYVAGSDPEDTKVDLIEYVDRSNMARISAASDYGSTCVFFDEDFMKKQEERLRVISMIEDGMENKEFRVYLQPKVSPETNKLVGSEALVRWQHPSNGIVGPNAFIPLCEQNGLICDLDLYVFDQVCAQIREWQDKGWKPKPISVNVSGMHLKDPDFVKEYREIAEKHGVDPSLIELELTESVMFSNLEMEEARSVIDTIRDYGFRCSMDDFGSGYSALGLLSDLPISCIKLDRSFFLDCIDNDRAQAVIEMIINLSKRLDITTVAEGIETDDQVEMLRGMGVDMIQGFYYSMPLPMSEFEKLVFVDKTTFPVDEDENPAA